MDSETEDNDSPVESIDEYLKRVSEIKRRFGISDGEYSLAFRGQEEDCWPLLSSAERRLRKAQPDANAVPNEVFIRYHQDLVDICKLKRFSDRDRESFTELELLADLQHHRAATCLIDFSRNALVALWFACEDSSKNGKVFLVDTANSRSFFEINRDDMQRSITDILKFETRELGNLRASNSSHPESSALEISVQKFWRWTPASLNERIPAQHSLFIFAPISSGKLDTEEILIDSQSKARIRNDLRDLHDIHEQTLFPDFVGFAYTQRHDATYRYASFSDHLRRGIQAAQRGEHTQSREHFDSAIAIEPSNWRGHYERGRLYSLAREWDHSIEDLTQAISMDPGPDLLHLVYTARGIAYSNNRENDNAIADFSTAINLNEDFSGSYIGRATEYLSLRKPQKAIQDSNRAIGIDGNSALAFTARGRAYELLNDLDSALRDQNRAIDINGNSATPYLCRAIIYEKQGNFGSGIQDLNKANEISPNSLFTRMRGRFYLKQRNFSHAMNVFERLLKLQPDESENHFHRGVCHLCLKQWEQAELDLVAASEMGVDVSSLFNEYYGKVTEFESNMQIQIPENIGSMLQD